LANWQGRTAEIANLKQWLNNPNIPLIGIEGIGGIGKSMLSAYIYENETIAGFRKRFWADVSSGAIFTDVATQVLQDFGFQVPEQETQLVQTLVKCLQSDEFLLIIDNLESLLKTNGIWGSQFYEDFFKTWVECGGKSKVIVTTRERPELPKRFQWLPLSGLKIADGVALLTALRIQGNLEEFVKLVDGYPLLLQFVADLLIEEYPQDPNLKRLENLGLGNLQQLLTDKKVVGQHRLENVGMVLVLDASFERLNELQKSLLQNISVYRGVVNAKAAMAVCLGSSETEIEKELRNLVKRSFLSEKLIDDGRWFEFQPVVLEYVRYKAGDQTEAHQKAIKYYQSIAKQQPWQTKDDIQEYLEIFYHFYQLADYDSAFEAIWHCNDFLTLRGYYANQVELYGQLVSKWSKTNDKENWHYQASLISLGLAYLQQGQYPEAIELSQQCLTIAREIGDRNTEGKSLVNLGLAYYSQGQYSEAIELFQQSLTIAREIGDRNSEGLSLMNLGLAYLQQGQYPEAIELFQQSLAIARDIGDRNSEGKSLMNLGLAYFQQGQYPEAIELFQQSLTIAREIGDRNTEGLSLANLGLAYFQQGQYPEAIELFQQSLAMVRDIGDLNSEGKSLMNLGLAYFQQGQYPEAIELFQQSLAMARDIGDRYTEGLSLMNLGSAYLNQGQYPEAIELFQQSLAMARDMGDLNSEAKAWFHLGLVLEEVYREPDALGAYRNARELFQTMGLDAGVQLCNDKIERLSQPKKPVVSQRGFWGWLRRLLRWLRDWFR